VDHGSSFGNLIDCTEQGLLNTYFHNKAPGREVTKLYIGRADDKADWQGENAPFAVHWITHVCPKPWRVADAAEPLEGHCDAAVYAYWRRVWNRLTASSSDASTAASVGSREQARRKMRRLTGVSAGPSLVGKARSLPPMPTTMSEWAREVRNGVGRQLRQVMHRRELRRRRYEYDAPWSEGTWAWIAIIGTLALGLAAGALLHKLFIKTPVEVGKGMTVVQAKRMGFQALGDKGPVGVVSAIDDEEDDDEEDDEDDEPAPPPKKGGKK
jgi:glycogenin glucosyltransferase